MFVFESPSVYVDNQLNPDLPKPSCSNGPSCEHLGGSYWTRLVRVGIHWQMSFTEERIRNASDVKDSVPFRSIGARVTWI